MIAHRLSRIAAVLAALLVLALPAPAAFADLYTGQIWSPGDLPSVPSVTGHNVGAPGQPTVRSTITRAATKYRPPVPSWPAPTDAIAVPTGAMKAVQIQVAPHADAVRAGVDGVLLGVTRTDGVHEPGSAPLRVDYRKIARNYGGDYAARLRVVELPACALTTPAIAACRAQTPLAAGNDEQAEQLTVTAPLAPAATTNAAKTATAAPDMTVLGVTSGPAGSGGDYSATSLSPTGTWAEAGNTGAFTYSYPITVPPALGGTAPTVSLNYDSQAVDGETSGRNTQASEIGDGWSMAAGGFIERSYEPCSQDGIAKSNDECWGGYNATLSLNGRSVPLIRDDVHKDWHLAADDGTSVAELSGADNDVWNGEYWLVTTPEGTKYYFGLNHQPGGNGGDPATDSAWGVPVYNPDQNDPCHTATDGANSFCTMGYRWNLDYVVDPHGNLETYTYGRETNYYDRAGGQSANNAGTLTPYVRGGYLSSISYGGLLSDAIAGAKPAAQVVFTQSQRCTTEDCTYASLSAGTASNWPDVPYDLNCDSAATTGGTGSDVCDVNTPTFWSTYAMTGITTKVLEGSTETPVDTYALAQSFLDAGGVVTPVTGSTPDPGAAGSTQAVMFLASVKRTTAGVTPPLAPTTFIPTELDNRVDGDLPAGPPLYRPRVAGVTTDTGASIGVTYYPAACSRVNNTMPAAADTNTMPCYPVYWTPEGDNAAVLDWFNKYLVKEVTTADATAAGSPTQVRDYAYNGGAAWHRDDSPFTKSGQRTWDQFRGFANVTETSGAAPDPVTQTVTTYLRGMNGDVTSGGTRSVSVADTVGDSVTDDNWLAGQPLEVDTYTVAGGTIDAKTVNGPWTFTTTASQAQPGGLPTLTARMPATTGTRTLDLLAGGAWRTSRTNTVINGQGQVAQVDAVGDVSLAGTPGSQEKCTATTYATPPTTNSMMLNYPAEVTVSAGPCTTPATAATMISDTRTYYNGGGNGSLSAIGTLGAITGAGDITATQTLAGYDTAGNPRFQAKSANTFDEYGRTTSTVDANGNVTKTAYSPATGALPTGKTGTNPMGWTTTTTLDQARQSPTKVVDPNGGTTVENYDPLGRLTAVWLPGHPTTAPADDTYAYVLDGTHPPTTTSGTLREDGSYAVDIKIYDGLAQPRQEQKTADSGGGRTVIDTHYDSHGWTVKTTSPFSNTDSGPSTTMFVPDDTKVPAETVTVFDGQHRPTATQVYSDAHQQWQTTTAYPGADQTDVTPPNGGTATSVFTDALGRRTASWSYQDSTKPTGKAADAVVANYAYTPAGDVAGVTEGANSWSYTYNLLGQKTSQTDPYSGTTTFGYDADGNLTSTTDARGQTVTTKYDGLSRKTGEYAGTTQLSAWTYDTLDKGYLTSSTSYYNGNAYVDAVTGYTPDYRAAGTSITIPAAEGKLAGTYTTTNTYSTNTAQLSSTAYSADGGLPAETVDYSYDLQGHVLGFGGNAPYLDTDSYTPLGQLQRTTFGPFGKQLVVTGTYDQATARPSTTTVNLQPATGAIDSYHYTYNQTGDLTSVADAQNTGATDTQCFGYDDLQRLTTAWSDTAGTTAPASGAVSTVGGCTTTTPATATIGGPAPYWQSYGYDLFGDRTSETNHNTTGVTSKDVAQTLNYANTSASVPQPDTVTSAVTTTGTGTATVAYGYDAMGNTTSRTTTTTGSAPPAGPNETISYYPTEETQSVTTTTNGVKATSTYLYRADGSTLLQRDPGSTTLYLDGGAEQLVLNTSTNTVSGLRYYPSPDGTTVIRSSTGTISYEIANKQHTSLELVDASSMAVTRRYFDPYGNTRGAAANWPDNHGFLGQPTDASTGLDLLGSREYDPVTGRFLQVDPLLEVGDVNQMGGYTYAADNPATGSDPTGQAFVDTGSGCVGTVQACDKSGWGNGDGSGGTGNGNGNGNGDDGSGVNGTLTNYLGSLPPDYQRVILHDPFKFDGGVIVARFFIPQKIAVPGVGVLGDHRGYSTDPNASSRMVMVWDTKTGVVAFIVAPSKMITAAGPQDPITQFTHTWVVPAHHLTAGPFKFDSWSGNNIDIKMTPDGISATYQGLNSVTPCCSVQGTLTITGRGARTTVHEDGMAYPNLEVIHYQHGQSPEFLAQSDMASFGGMNSVPHFERFRDQTWVGGVRTSSSIHTPGFWAHINDFIGWI